MGIHASTKAICRDASAIEASGNAHALVDAIDGDAYASVDGDAHASVDEYANATIDDNAPVNADGQHDGNDEHESASNSSSVTNDFAANEC